MTRARRPCLLGNTTGRAARRSARPGLADAGLFRDLIDQTAVNQTPAEMLGQQVGELGPPAAVLALDRDDPDHGDL